MNKERELRAKIHTYYRFRIMGYVALVFLATMSFLGRSLIWKVFTALCFPILGYLDFKLDAWKQELSSVDEQNECSPSPEPVLWSYEI